MLNILIIIVILFVSCTIQDEYGVIIDAGISSSKVYLYAWDEKIPNEVEAKLSVPITQRRWWTSVTPGFTQFVGDDSGLERHLKDCLDFVLLLLKDIGKSTDKVVLYFYATAAARLLNPNQRDEMMEKVGGILSKSGFLFFERNCKIITGGEEAFYEWLTVNYIKDTLLAPEESYGVLDMDGTSMRIALYYTKDIIENIYNIRIFDRNYQMYVHSFLRYGIDEAKILSYVELINGNAINLNDNNINHPCYPLGYTFIYRYDGNVYYISGTSKYDECLGLTKDILKIDSHCNVEPCSFDGTYQPNFVSDPKNKFIAFGGFVFITTLLKKSHILVKEIDEYAQRICPKRIQDMELDYPNFSNSSQFCFYASYIYTLFSSGLQFHDDRNITFSDRLEGQNVYWTTGAMTVQANLYPTSNEIPEYSDTAVIALAAFYSFMLGEMLFIALLVFKLKVQR